MSEIYGIIFARAGSKGIINKNLQVVGGKTLVEHAIRTAQAARGITRVLVSTDSVAIAEVAKSFGADVPFMRPKELAMDSSAEWLAWQHALQWFDRFEGVVPEAFVSVPTTSPLRKVTDVEKCIATFGEERWDAVVTVTEARRNPAFNMVRLDASNEASLASAPLTPYVRRQDAPALYDMCTVAYVLRSEFVIRNSSIWSGRVGAVRIPQERSLDIDTQFDLKLARLLIDQDLEASSP